MFWFDLRPLEKSEGAVFFQPVRMVAGRGGGWVGMAAREGGGGEGLE